MIEVQNEGSGAADDGAYAGGGGIDDGKGLAFEPMLIASNRNVGNNILPWQNE